MTPTTPRTRHDRPPVAPPMTYRPPLPLTRPMPQAKPPVRPGIAKAAPPPSRTARINALVLLALLLAFVALGWVLTR
jgi:hypothetical protein